MFSSSVSTMAEHGGASADVFAVLGLAPGAAAREVHVARRRLAKAEHPDVGGSEERMRRINEAADAALEMLARRSAATGRPERRPGRGSDAEPDAWPVCRDHPSFVVEALPVEAFEALRIVASWLGDVVDDDPPYSLEMVFADPPGIWCRLDLVPDAGSSTVSVTASGDAGSPTPDVESIRDVLIDALNRLDWSMLDD
jgi:hypothetical protein